MECKKVKIGVESITTKFGTAKLNNDGYWVITSCKEGNAMKLLHRLIWEDFYRCEVPKDYHIHHKNENKLDCCILNLQLIHKSEHLRLHKIGEANHMWGKKHSEESKCKMSKSKNTTGYLNVSKQKNPNYKKGFTWRYTYYDDGERKTITSTDIEKLEAKVKARDLKWLKYDKEDK